MGRKLTILVDIDDVLNNFTGLWARLLDERYATGLGREDIREWEMTATYTMLTKEQIFGMTLEEDFYRGLRPVENAAPVLRRLIDDGHDVYIVSDTDWRVVPVKMREFLFKYYPFLSWDRVILTAHKQLIRGDVLIDDAPKNLVGGDYAKLLWDAPYNRSFDAEANGMVRVYDWDGIYGILNDMRVD